MFEFFSNTKTETGPVKLHARGSDQDCYFVTSSRVILHSFNFYISSIASDQCLLSIESDLKVLNIHNNESNEF